MRQVRRSLDMPLTLEKLPVSDLHFRGLSRDDYMKHYGDNFVCDLKSQVKVSRSNSCKQYKDSADGSDSYSSDSRSYKPKHHNSQRPDRRSKGKFIMRRKAIDCQGSCVTAHQGVQELTGLYMNTKSEMVSSN